MANTATNVSVGKPKKAGAIWRAPASATLPKSASETLSEDFSNVGYISDDGFTNGVSIDSESTKAWGGDTVLTSQTGFEETFRFMMIESLNPVVLKAVYGDDNVEVTASGDISVEVSGEEQVDHAWVIDVIMRNNAAKRIVIPQAAMTDLSDVVYKDDEVIGYEVTLTATPDSNGKTHYEYIIQAENNTSDSGGTGDTGNTGNTGDTGNDEP